MERRSFLGCVAGIVAMPFAFIRKRKHQEKLWTIKRWDYSAMRFETVRMSELKRYDLFTLSDPNTGEKYGSIWNATEAPFRNEQGVWAVSATVRFDSMPEIFK